MNLISRLFQIKMVDFKIQTSNTSLFFKTTLILNKNITPLDTKMAHSYRWPLLYYGLRRQKNLDFSNFFFILWNPWSKPRKTVISCWTPVVPKRQNNPSLNWRSRSKICIFFAFLSICEIQLCFSKYLWCFQNFKNGQKTNSFRRKRGKLAHLIRMTNKMLAFTTPPPPFFWTWLFIIEIV